GVLFRSRSEPAADSTVTTAPRELRLWFSQRPELAFTSARVSRAGTQVEVGRAALGSSELEGVLVVLPIQEVLPPGNYDVAWRTMASDGHVITGEFSFSIAGSGQTDAR